MRETIGWTLFIISFLVSCIFAQEIPPVSEIPAIQGYSLLGVLIGEVLLVFGYFRREKDKIAGVKNPNPVNLPNLAGTLLIALSGLMIITKVDFSRWQVFFVGAFFAIIGLAILNKPQKHAAHPVAEEAGHVDPLIYVDKILEQINQMNLEEMDHHKVKKELEEIELNLVIPFVDNRHYFIHEYGVSTFAEFFSLFSSGERYLNRAWSSLVDGYHQETKNSIVKASNYFKQTREMLLTMLETEEQTG